MMGNSKLLLVDDEPLNLILYDKMLDGFDFEIIKAANGKECIEKVDLQKPDLILMDWNMPVLDGIDALKILKNNTLTSGIPVLMITGVMTSAQDLAYALSLGAIDFLKKPFEALELIARVKNILLLSETFRQKTEQIREVENKNILITSLIESIPHPVIYCSLDGVLHMCNIVFEQVAGMPRADMIGNSVYQFFIEEELSVHKQKDADLIQNKIALFYETNVFPGNRKFIISKNIVTDIQDIPVGIITTFIDISDIKKASDELLNLKKTELIASTLRSMHLNKLNSSLISDLEKLKPCTNNEGQELIRQIKHKFELNMREQIWNDFDTRIENAYDSFSIELLQKFPQLTPNERKLCTLLRTGLSSKEIAILTFQNPQSIDVARYRLRKKLNLVNDENLIDFLLHIDN